MPNLELRDDIRITDTAPIVRRMEDSDRPRDIHPAERVSVLAALSLVARKAVVPVTAPNRPFSITVLMAALGTIATSKAH